MSINTENEITVKIKGSLENLYKKLEEKSLKITNKFSIDDTYFVPETLNLIQMKTREILSKAILVRKFIGKRTTQKITFKIKKFAENGNILSQEVVNCDVLEIEDAKQLLKAIGYREIMNIKEEDKEYDKNGFKLLVKEVENSNNLIEAETNSSYDTIEKLVQKLNELEIPIYKDNYFVKKAEIQLDKLLKR